MFLIGRHALRAETVDSLYENNINNNNTSAMYDKCGGERQKRHKDPGLQIFFWNIVLNDKTEYNVSTRNALISFNVVIYLFLFKYLLQSLTILRKTWWVSK